MKVSKDWLKEFVDLNVPMEELEKLLPLRTIATKEITDNFIELDMKGYNRADLLSMRGVAYEIAAITDSALKISKIPQDFIWVGKNLPKVEVKIENDELCPVYCVAKIEGLKVEPSSPDIVKKLTDCGIRSIDNITDITNLMMLEYGQTMHAFDADKVTDETMIVRIANNGEEFQTLDGKNQKLTKDDLLITDTKGILSLSGIMGGKNSEVTNNTNTILLEVAIFDPISIRKTSQRLGISSEASKRIQHGLSSIHLLQALDAAIRKYEEFGGKFTAISLIGNFDTTEKKLDLRISKTKNLIGIDLDEGTITESLTKLGFIVSKKDTDTLSIIVPYFRLDINIEEDLIEEVARIYGYEKIPAKPIEGELPEKIDQTLPNFIYDLKKNLVDSGLTEIQTYSFFSTQVLSALGLNEENKKNVIRVANPISSETEYMRTFIWPNLVEVVGKNIKQNYKDIAIFEIGKVYTPVEGDLPKEGYRLAIALMNSTDNPIDELVSIVKKSLSQITLKQGGLMKELETLFHPNRFATTEIKGKTIGGLAEVHPRLLNYFGIEKRVAILEISIENLIS